MTPARNRGQILLYLGLAIVVLLLLGGLIAWADSNIATRAGVKKGEASKQKEWSDANDKAQSAAAALQAAREATGRQAATALQQANQTASDWEARYQKEKRRGIPLVVCPQPAATPRPPGSVDTPTDSGLRFTYAFLRDYDAGWTGQSGEPVFGGAGGVAGTGPEAAAASEVGLEELLDLHRENASRCSSNARQLDRLTALIRQLQQAPVARP